MSRQKKLTYETERKPFPECLRELLFKNNVSQIKLAEFVGCTRQAISLYATGQSTPDIDILLKIAEYFKVSTDYLLGLSGDIKTTDIEIRRICEITGLSEKAIRNLQRIRNGNAYEAQNQQNQLIQRVCALNLLLQHGDLEQLIKYIVNLSHINFFIEAEGLDAEELYIDQVEKATKAKEDKLYVLFCIQNLIKKIVEDFSIEFDNMTSKKEQK